jgi:glycosyltransferase involved in cell wall biosynthesis
VTDLHDVAGAALMSRPLASILINNYNYARFLDEAIDSALSQSYPSKEIIVVDDGSTDNSREIISRYGDRIIPILKENGGQASAFNAGVARCQGDILCFLDSDDFFHPDKLERVAAAFHQQGMNSRAMLVHHFLAIKSHMDNDLDGDTFGKTHDSPMNLYAFARRYRFLWNEIGPTTSISINRRLADRLFPISERARISADAFIACGASLVGEAYFLKEILGGYRVHGNNNWHGAEQRISQNYSDALQEYLNRKLVENNLAPVISFDDSIYAWPRLVSDRRWSKLAWHMLRLSALQRDRYTAKFVYYTLMSIAQLGMKMVKSRAHHLGVMPDRFRRW